MLYSFILIVALLIILVDTDIINITLYSILFLLITQFCLWYLLYTTFIVDVFMWLTLLYIIDIIICMLIINILESTVLKLYSLFCMLTLLYTLLSIINIQLYMPKLGPLITNHYIDFILFSYHVKHNATRFAVGLLLSVGILL